MRESKIRVSLGNALRRKALTTIETRQDAIVRLTASHAAQPARAANANRAPTVSQVLAACEQWSTPAAIAARLGIDEGPLRSDLDILLALGEVASVGGRYRAR